MLCVRLEGVLTEADLAFEMPLRVGPRTLSCRTLPHLQLNQRTPPIVGEDGANCVIAEGSWALANPKYFSASNH
jgi:hypothetical protein